MSSPGAFIPGTLTHIAQPLARYLPPIPDGIASAWLQAHLPLGSWVLDPFGACPRLAVEAARNGYRVLVAANNPVSRVLIESAARPPSETDLHAALAALGAASKGSERMETHITGLYQTLCSRCGRRIMADAFLWERGAPGPYARIYRCPVCGDSGEHPCTSEDVDLAASFAGGGMHRARALERVAALDDPDRQNVEEALSVYLPRAVYVIFNLINKVDGLALSPDRRSGLLNLLLSACDQANTLWSHPNTRERPRQLTTGHRFKENNIWLALEEAVALWAQPGPLTAIEAWPEVPPLEGGICLYEGRLRDLADSLSEMEIRGVVTVLPRPNQAFWTLSALWSGWLWGREAVGPFKSVLRRRRYDWGWHAAALTAAFTSLSSRLKPDVPMFGLIGEMEAGFLTAAVTSADAAGFDLEGIAFRKDQEVAQLTWKKGAGREIDRVSSAASQKAALTGCTELLKLRGQPAGYLRMQAAALQEMAHEGVLQHENTSTQAAEPGGEPTPSQNLQRVQAIIKDTFTPRSGLVRVGAEKNPGADRSSIEAGLWWLKIPEGTERILPVADRVEIEVVRYLLRNQGSSSEEIDAAICASFPGLLTPDWELTLACLESYGQQDLRDGMTWRLRERESPSARRQDLINTRQNLSQLGERLGYRVSIRSERPEAPTPGSTALLWSQGEQARFAFTILASAALSEPVFSRETPPAGLQSVIVLPGSRANLVAYKLEHDPLLKAKVEAGWLFLKYRHLRQLLENPGLTPLNVAEQMKLDPLTHTAPQIRML